MRDSASVIVCPLPHVTNLSFIQGIVPDDLQSARVVSLFMPPKELWGGIYLSLCPSVPLRVRCISLIFFEIGIPNLVCGCILEWRSVAYRFRVTVTLTSDLVYRVRSIFLILFELGILSFVCGCILGRRSVMYHPWVTVTLTSDLVFRIIVSRVYLPFYLRYEFQIWCGCIFGWWSVLYNLQVTVALHLTSDLDFKIIMSGAYLQYYLR